MASHGWRSDHSVIEWLHEEGHRFDFYQAVRLLELSHPWLRPVAEGTDPEREPVRFVHVVDFSFPASPVRQVEPPEREAGQAEMEETFLGLAGALGPLPAPWTELILERGKRRDHSLKDFLDIFNHRLVSLMYRARKLRRLGFEWAHPYRTRFAAYAYGLMGMGTRGLRTTGEPSARGKERETGRLEVHDGALLRYTALLAQQPRSMVGLEVLLRDYFRVPVRGRQFVGGWYVLEPEQHTRIGTRKGSFNVLGRGAMLGTRVWEQRAAFTVTLGPMDLQQYLDMLPVGTGFRPLCKLVRFYAESEHDWNLRLCLSRSQAPQARLSTRDGALLGWTSWLGETKPEQDPTVPLTPRRWVEEPFDISHEL